jgi:glutaminase
MNVSLVRSVATGETRVSRRVYPPEQAERLRADGHRIKLIEVDGAIFFGTADRLGARAAHEAEGARFLILDLRRVTMIDASGALMLERLSRRLRQSGGQMLLAHISATHPLGRALIGAGVFTERHHPDWFTDTDRALEWAERQLLTDANAEVTQRAIQIGDFALMTGLSGSELEFMKPYLDRQLFPARAPLFREGEHGDRVYLLARGAVSVVAADPAAGGQHRRMVTLAPGVMFGESAIVEGSTRFATAIAEEESVTYSLSRANLEAIRKANPDLYQRLLLNMLAHLSELLRMAAGVVRETSDAVD